MSVHLSSFKQLISVLFRWFIENHNQDPSTKIETRYTVDVFTLNSDTTLKGVKELLKLFFNERGLKISIGQSTHGNLTKVLFGSNKQAISGVYMYLKNSDIT